MSAPVTASKHSELKGAPKFLERAVQRSKMWPPKSTPAVPWRTRAHEKGRLTPSFLPLPRKALHHNVAAL